MKKFMHAADIKRIERERKNKEKEIKIKERRNDNERLVIDDKGLVVTYKRWLEGKGQEDCWQITKD